MNSKHESEELRIVLLGKTGVGKSVSGNLILGRESFPTELSSASVTINCKTETREFDGQTLAIVDTPGLFHTSKNGDELMKEILEIIMSIVPGPHVLLLVLKAGDFSRQDKHMLETFKKVFQDAKGHTIVLFTHGDKEKDVEGFINKHPSLREFLDKSCEAYHVFNNKDKDESQVTSLLQNINKMVEKNERRYYSNEMFEEAVTALDKAMEQPEVKLASHPKEEGMKWLEGWISKGLDEVKKHTPQVISFLKILEESAYKHLIKLPEAVQ